MSDTLQNEQEPFDLAEVPGEEELFDPQDAAAMEGEELPPPELDAAGEASGLYETWQLEVVPADPPALAAPPRHLLDD